MSQNRGGAHGLRRLGAGDPARMTLDRASMRSLQFLLLQRQLSVWVAAVAGTAVPPGDSGLVDELRSGEVLCELLERLCGGCARAGESHADPALADRVRFRRFWHPAP